MYVDGAPPLKIDSIKDILYSGPVIFKTLKKYEMLGEREFLVVDKRNKVIGCLGAAEAIRLYPNKKALFLSDLLLANINTAYENSLTLKKIMNVNGKHRSLFIVKDGTKRKRFQKYNFNDVLAEITVKLAFKGILNESTDYPNLLRYDVKV